jgi:hypothetical protein
MDISDINGLRRTVPTWQNVAIQQVSATWLFVANDDLVGGVCAPVLDGGG